MELKSKEDIQNFIKTLQNQIRLKNELNKNLIRIARERGSRKNNLPKKSSGYLFRNKVKTSVRFVENDGYHPSEEYFFDVWKITYTTPWDCSLKEQEIDSLVIADLNKKLFLFGEENARAKENVTRLTLSHVQKYKDDKNIILQWQYNFNGRTGLVDVTFVTFDEPIPNEINRTTYA